MANNYMIKIGSVSSPQFSFSGDEIESLIMENAVDIIGNELSSDIMEVGVFHYDTNSSLQNLPYATTIYFYNNENFAGKYYVTKVDRTARTKYLLHCTSLIGLIEREQFYGNFYVRARFEDVLREILFSDSPVYKNYKEYKAECLPESRTSSVYGYYGVNLVDGRNWDAKKKRLQAAFTFGDAVWAGNGELQRNGIIVGRYDGTYYSVRIYQARSSTSSPTYFSIEVAYGASSYSVGDATPLIGAGSYVSIDVNPNAGTLQIDVDYIKYDDTTTTGHLTRSETITPWSGNSTACLDVAFSPNSSGTRQYGYAHILWDYYRVYNEDGTLRIDAGLAVDIDNTRYVYNKANGVYGTPTRIAPYGSELGSIGDIKRYAQSQELLDSIEMDDAIANTLINGWLPVSTRREALHALLFAENISILKTQEGKLLLTAITEGTPITIADTDIYDETQEEPVSTARNLTVTEYSFTIPTDPATVIYDDSDAPAVSGEHIALFNNAPIYGTPVGNGISILSYNANAAVVTGRGTITGTPYISAQNDIRYQDTSVYDGQDVSVGNIAIISSLNSDNVMNKLKAYYCASVKKIGIGIVYREQRCGIRYLFQSLFDTTNIGYLSKASLKASSFIKADCEFVSGYVPPSSGGYGAYQIVEYDEEWSVPQAVREREYANIRLILIGTGENGTNGGAGQDGSYAQEGSGQRQGGNGGNGGAAGLGGAGGNVYQITVDVTNVAKITAAKTGNNTIVKTYNDNDSVISTYSSSSGNPVENGITNLFTGEIYARKGKDGRAGGKGGVGVYSGDGYSPSASNGEDVSVPYQSDPFKGGRANTVNKFGHDTAHQTAYYSYESGGGGAADGSNGGVSYQTGSTAYKYYFAGGSGGNAIQQFNVYTGYGSGGFGGNGGGGGGGAGVIIANYYGSGSSTYSTESQTPGTGGTGSNGTNGIEGCLLIYY